MIQEYIAWLDISVYNFAVVAEVQGVDEFQHDGFDLLWRDV